MNSSFNKLVLPSLRGSSSRLAHSGDKTGFMEKVFGIKVEKATQAHSVLLGDQQVLFELQIHNVKPDKTADYEKYHNEYAPNMLKNYNNLKLTGSWKSEIGVLDQYVHLWRYKNFSDYSQVFYARRKDDVHQQYTNKIGSYLNKNETQICLSFTFWGEPPIREPSHIYEMRSYALKPGTLFEWGNNWSRGIRNRLDYRVAGMFTQIGPLYYVHHIWAYKDFVDRKEAREKMWNKPGWDECVSNTVPLIRKMESRMMTALTASPTQ